MNEGKLSVILERADWISIARALTTNLGKMVDIMPVVRLLESLTQNGIRTSELDPKGGR